MSRTTKTLAPYHENEAMARKAAQGVADGWAYPGAVTGMGVQWDKGDEFRYSVMDARDVEAGRKIGDSLGNGLTVGVMGSIRVQLDRDAKEKGARVVSVSPRGPRG